MATCTLVMSTVVMTVRVVEGHARRMRERIESVCMCVRKMEAVETHVRSACHIWEGGYYVWQVVTMYGNHGRVAGAPRPRGTC